MMPAGSEKLTAARKEEIVDACAQLYEVMPFKNITLGVIGEKTSFTRTSIYNYFRTKEEIFLALLEREYTAWVADLLHLTAHTVEEAQFPAAFAALLERRKCMLKLLSMNLYDMESGSRLENLVTFKRVYGAALTAVAACVRAHLPRLSESEVQRFLYAFFPFLFGIYPYSEASEKQKKAMDIVGIPYPDLSVSALVAPFVSTLLGCKK